MKKYIKTVISICTALAVITGCGLISGGDNTVGSAAGSSMAEGEGKMVELTERQKEILEKEGLPTDYYELEGLQQDAISKIEKCFQYLDDTYPDDTFTYYYYEGINLMGDGGDRLHVLSEKIGNGRVVTVSIRHPEKEDKDVFWDDYRMTMDSNLYEEEITKYVRSQLPDAEFFVDANIHQYVEGDSYIMERAAGYSCIVFNDTFSTEQEVKEFLEKIADWMNSYNKHQAKTISCVIFCPDDYKDANLSNYNDLSKKRRPKFYADCIINVDQNVRVNVYTR